MIDAADHAARLLARLEAPVREKVAAIPELEALLAQHLGAAAAAWPSIAIDAELYLRHLAAKLGERRAEPAAHVLATMPAADLYLAAACAAGDAQALATFRAAMMPGLRATLRRLAATPAMIDEIEQRVLEMLFVASPPARPQIATYSGRGQLRSWVRSIGVRTGRRMMGAEHCPGNADELERLPAAVADPELQLFRTTYLADFRVAFARALAALAERPRNVLRQYYLDGLTTDQLGALYRVNRATAARWVSAAREGLLAATREHLAAALVIPISEVDSIIRLVRSQLDVTLRELFVDR